MSSTPTSPTSWNDTVADHKQRVRGAIVDATLELLGRSGLSAITMSEVARAAGMTRKTLYTYFRDVESILVAHVEGEIARFRSELAAPAGEPLARLTHFLRQALAAWSVGPAGPAGPAVADASLSPNNLAVVRTALDGLRDDLRALLLDAVAAGQVRDDLDLDLAADVLLGALTGAREHLLRLRRPPDEVADELERLVLGTIGSR